MNIKIGDLVNCRNHDKKLGLVVEKKPSNEGLTHSKHVQHLINVYQNVYYVYFCDEGKTGPHHESDLSLQQSFT
jgi:hypothetical protein